MVHHCRLHCQHFETSSLFETTGWIEVKFYVRPPWDGGTKFVHVVWVTGPFMVKTLRMSSQNHETDDFKT